MKVSLVNPPFVLEDYYKRLGRVGSVQQPLGLGYLAATLREFDHEIQIIDAPALGQTPQQTLRALRHFDPEMIGVTSTTPGHGKASYLAKLLRDKVDATLVLGGPHVTALPEQSIAEDGFDIGVLGEGEQTLLELVNRVESGNPWKDIRGIAYNVNGEVTANPRRSFIQDLDSLPFPARNLMPPLELYHPTPSAYRRLPQATMITSRGCPYRCTFCDRAVFGNHYRTRSPDNVVDEMELLTVEYGVREIRFWDDSFNIDRQRVVDISREIRKRKLDLTWTAVVRINPMNRKVLRAMATAGCWQVEYGIESSSQRILDRIRKNLTPDLVRRVVRVTKEEGIRIRGFFMLGLPGETENSMRDTIRFAKSLDLDMAVFHITTPFPGTELYNQALESGELREEVDYSRYLMFASEEFPYVPKGLTRELLTSYQKKAYMQFYLRPSYILQRLADIRNLEDIRRYGTGMLAIAELV